MTRIASALCIVLASTVLWPQESSTPSNANKAALPTGSYSAAIPPDSTKLEAIKIVRAEYPPEARAQNLTGHVVVKVTVSESGDVENAEAVSGEPLLAKAAVDAVKEWKFKPYIKNGRAIRVSANMPCDFAPPAKSNANTSAEDNASTLLLSSQGVDPPPMVASTDLVVIKKEQLKYPRLALLEDIQGSVLVRVVISQAGDVEKTEVLSGDPILARATVESVNKWKFQPVVRDGIPVKVSTNLNFNFAFKDKVVDYEPHVQPSAPAESKAGASGKPSAASSPLFLPQKTTAGMLIHRVQPVYPPEAKAARIQGSVVLAAIIAKDGSVKNLRVISGSRALVGAAVGAVQQWRYRPYMLNGEPVEVESQITVNFTIGSIAPELPRSPF